METSASGLFELALVFGGLLAFLLWELVSISRTLKRDEDSKAAPRSEDKRAP
jgi:hypothetical protein